MKLTILDYSTSTTHIIDFDNSKGENLEELVESAGFKLSEVEYMITRKIEMNISHE